MIKHITDDIEVLSSDSDEEVKGKCHDVFLREQFSKISILR